ncbi:MAG: RNA chaperone Hfq [Armatimonadota bacterium]
MNKSQLNLQDTFLNQVRKDNVMVTIYLVSGVQLKGHVRAFDSFTVLFESPGKPAQLVYKHAMASVVPTKNVHIALAREESAETEQKTLSDQEQLTKTIAAITPTEEPAGVGS